MKTLTKEIAEQSTFDALEEGRPSVLASFADFAAGEIDDKHISALLLAILQADSSRWAFMLSTVKQFSPDLAEAIGTLEHELERKRAAFIEHYAANAVALVDMEMESRNVSS